MFASWERISDALVLDNWEFTVQKKNKADILLNTRKETGLEVDTDKTNIWPNLRFSQRWLEDVTLWGTV
jgi:hypothetical protein